MAPPQASSAAVQGYEGQSGEASNPKKEIKTYTLPPEKYQKAVAYSRAQYRLYFIDSFYGFLILFAVLKWRIGPKYRDWAERVSSRRFLQVVLYAPLLLITLGIIGLPTTVYGQWLALKYDQSIQHWGSWFWDWAKGELIAAVIGTFVIWILFGIIRRSPRRWWFYFWLASVPIIVFLLFVSPVFIDPLFFKFEPLQAKQPALVSEIEKVVQHGGLAIPPDRMFQLNASKKLKAVNAYVTGIGLRSQR